METCLKCNTNKASAYLAGFCHDCAKPILAASAKRMKVVRSSDSADKKLREDIGRAEYAIACLRRVIADPTVLHLKYASVDTPANDAALVAACEAELIRLQRALVEPWRLWSIYRSGDKGQPYGTKPVALAA